MPSTEITLPSAVLDSAGRPRGFGWARSPLFIYDPGLYRGPQRQLDSADRYIIFSPSYMVILEARDGLLGYGGASLVSLRDKKRSTQAYTAPFSLGGFLFPPSSAAGQVKIELRRSLLDFTAMEGGGGARVIKVDIPHFGRRRSLRGEIVLTPPPEAESIVTNMPWRLSPRAFRCLRHSPWYIAEGVIQSGATEVIFTKGNSWGIFEWERGARPVQDTRYWAAAAGLCGGRLAAINAGYDGADAAWGTENAFFLDGRLHKLDQVTFHINPSDWTAPWRFTSNDNRLEMTFTPRQERGENRRLFLYYHKRRQFFGVFSGAVVLDNGEVFSFRDLTGFAERRKTRF